MGSRGRCNSADGIGRLLLMKRDPFERIERMIDTGSKVALVGAIFLMMLLVTLHHFGIHN